MSVFGIICETNPMHNGHKYLIDQAKSMGAEYVVCIMSGNTVQRGEFAVADKYVRAEALVKCGADLVIELPFPWSSSSAESFAMGGVKIASEICDTLIFGSECGDTDLLLEAAKKASSEEFKKEYSLRLSEGSRAAELYYGMLSEKTGAKFSSNDLLGIEYIKTIINLGKEMNVLTVKRLGDNYMSDTVSDSKFTSAMAIRKLWGNDEMSTSIKYIPKEALEVYEKAREDGKIADINELDAFWLSYFRLNDGNKFSDILGERGGLVNRICEISHNAKSYEELLSAVKNKRYTDSHIRRTMLHCVAGTTEEDIKSLPTETLLLGANAKGRELLSKTRKNDNIKIITKPADLDVSLRQNILSRRIDAIYSLAFKCKMSADTFLKMKPYIE